MPIKPLLNTNKMLTQENGPGKGWGYYLAGLWIATIVIISLIVKHGS